MTRKLVTLTTLILFALFAVACGGGGKSSGGSSGDDGDDNGGAEEFDPQGRFVAEWFGTADVELSVSGPSGVHCEATQKSAGSAGNNAEIIDCVDDNGDAASGMYQVLVENRSGSTATITLRAPETDTRTFDVTRDYTAGRIRNIAVARTQNIYLQLNWGLNEDHDIRLFDLATGDYTGQFPIAGRNPVPGCVGTFDRGDVFGPHQESMRCTNLALGLYQMEFHRNPIIFSTENYTAQVRTAAGGQGFAIADTLSPGSGSVDAFFLIVPGAVR